jgi:hypothetical protein
VRAREPDASAERSASDRDRVALPRPILGVPVKYYPEPRHCHEYSQGHGKAKGHDEHHHHHDD